MEEKDKSVLLGFDTATYQKKPATYQKETAACTTKTAAYKKPCCVCKKTTPQLCAQVAAVVVGASP